MPYLSSQQVKAYTFLLQGQSPTNASPKFKPESHKPTGKIFEIAPSPKVNKEFNRIDPVVRKHRRTTSGINYESSMASSTLRESAPLEILSHISPKFAKEKARALKNFCRKNSRAEPHSSRDSVIPSKKLSLNLVPQELLNNIAEQEVHTTKAKNLNIPTTDSPVVMMSETNRRFNNTSQDKIASNSSSFFPKRSNAIVTFKGKKKANLAIILQGPSKDKNIGEPLTLSCVMSRHFETNSTLPELISPNSSVKHSTFFESKDKNVNSTKAPNEKDVRSHRRGFSVKIESNDPISTVKKNSKVTVKDQEELRSLQRRASEANMDVYNDLLENEDQVPKKHRVDGRSFQPFRPKENNEKIFITLARPTSKKYNRNDIEEYPGHFNPPTKAKIGLKHYVKDSENQIHTIESSKCGQVSTCSTLKALPIGSYGKNDIRTFKDEKDNSDLEKLIEMIDNEEDREDKYLLSLTEFDGEQDEEVVDKMQYFKRN